MRKPPKAVLFAGLLVPLAVNAQQPVQEVTVQALVFGSAEYATSERDVSEGFALGQVVGHVTASLDPRLSVFAEATLTPRANEHSPSLERAIVRYDFSDAIKFSGGRFHTPVSWWNTAYHHGSWLQPTVDRPTPVAYSTPLIPIHFLGVLAEGSLPAGPVTVLYDVGLGNGRQENISRPGDSGDDNGFRAVLGGLKLRPVGRPGVEFGVHVYRDRIPVTSGSVNETILSAHAVTQGRPFELMAEYLRISNDPTFGPSASFDSDAWYVEAGYHLPARFRSLLPYARYERIEPAAGDPVFGDSAIDLEAWIAGIRWDFSSYTALKAEYRVEDLPVDDGQTFVLNASFVIPSLVGAP